MEKTEIMRWFIHQEVLKALVNARLSYDHPIGCVLEREAEIVGQNACVRVLDQNGGWVMLEERIEELKADERFRGSVSNPSKVGHRDELSIRDNFDQIATGGIVVE